MNKLTLFSGAACLIVLGLMFGDLPSSTSVGLGLMWIGLASIK